MGTIIPFLGRRRVEANSAKSPQLKWTKKNFEDYLKHSRKAEEILKRLINSKTIDKRTLETAKNTGKIAVKISEHTVKLYNSLKREGAYNKTIQNYQNLIIRSHNNLTKETEALNQMNAKKIIYSIYLEVFNIEKVIEATITELKRIGI